MLVTSKISPKTILSLGWITVTIFFRDFFLTPALTYHHQNHLFIHSFIHSSFCKQLLCARHCVKGWRYKDDNAEYLFSQEVII